MNGESKFIQISGELLHTSKIQPTNIEQAQKLIDWLQWWIEDKKK